MEDLRTLLKNDSAHDLPTDECWDIKNYLFNKGELVKAGDKGGSVRLQEPIKEKPAKAKKEADLYKLFMDYVKNLWVKDNGIKEYIVQNTAN